MWYQILSINILHRRFEQKLHRRFEQRLHRRFEHKLHRRFSMNMHGLTSYDLNKSNILKRRNITTS